MDKKVQGTFFLDYIRMIKSRKDVAWSKYLTPSDQSFLQQKIVKSEYYPMDAFERMGIGILKEIAQGNMELVRTWGRLQADELAKLHPEIVSEGDPRESLIRFQVVRNSYFNFDAINILIFFRNYAKLEIAYHMSPLAEEAASWQALGYFERLLELSGATYLQPRFTSKLWAGDSNTILEVNWSNVSPDKKVKGALFGDYVRMIRNNKGAEWGRWLRPQDLALLEQKIVDTDWYQFETFERMGVAILKEVAFGDLDLVRLWGQQSVDRLIQTNPALICEGDPRETLLRFQVLRRSFFNFNAIDIESLLGNYAKLRVDYDMSRAAEPAAVHQALGFFEKLLELSGAKGVQTNLLSKSWEGDPTTILELKWT